MYKIELRDFILSHENWEELLTSDPYNLKLSRDQGYIIFKYNQISSDFSIPLVREARGIIFREKDWECVCHPFNKFGNYGESYCPEIDWSTASVQEKVDGSLLKIWFDNDWWYISTNSTIDAFKAELNSVKYKNFGELAISAIKNMLNTDKGSFFDYLDKNYTHMFELVSPYNRVVIPYEKVKLYYLGSRNKVTGIEERISNYPFLTPKFFALASLEDVQNAASVLPWDKEGYVVCDGNFNRVKIKSPAYVEIHYARNNNVITRENLVQIILDGEQKEFSIYASDYIEELQKVESLMNKVAHQATTEMRAILGTTYNFESRAEYAKNVSNYSSYAKDFLFHCFDDKIFWDYAKASWNTKKWIKAIEEFENKEN